MNPTYHFCFHVFFSPANKVNKAAYSDLENGTIKNGDASKHRELTDSKPQQVIDKLVFLL